VNARLLPLLCLWLLASQGCDGHTLPVFTLQVDVPAPAVQRGTSTEIPFHIDRSGPAQPVQVILRDPPDGVSVEPVHVRADQDSGVLHVHASDQTAVGDYTLDVVAKGFSRDDTDSILLQVRDIPASAPMVVVTEEKPPVLVKGGTTGVSFQVDRSGGFSGSFRVEPKGPLPPWVSFEPVSVPYDATGFTLQVKVDEPRPVGAISLALKLTSGSRSGSGELVGEIIAPPEAPPQLTSVEPPAYIRGTSYRLTLKGTGLSDARAVVAAGFGTVTILSATSTELQADLRMYMSHSLGVFPATLAVRTSTGEATFPVTVSNIHVDPITGSDTTGTGAVPRPFASLSRALDACPPCVEGGFGMSCWWCPITLAPGIHQAGSVGMGRSVTLVGTGDLYGSNPSTLEATAETHSFRIYGSEVRNLKLSGYKQGLQAFAGYRLGPEQQRVPVYPLVEDVWLTGGDYGLSVCEGVTVRAVKAPVRISHNRIAGIHCNGRFNLTGSAAWPVEVIHNGDGSPEAGGVIAVANVTAEYLVASHNQGAGMKARYLTARDSIFQGNAGPGVWAFMSGANLGTVAAPGGNTLQDNAINLRIDGNSSESVTAVGNCWNPPTGNDYADTTQDGACGRIRKPFSLSGTSYIDAQGRAETPFTWTEPPRFNYFLSSTGAGTPVIQF
jgi:hypothetical protein